MTRTEVALFVTCLVDIFRPEAGFAAVRLLEHAGCDVVVPVQTCCGQPAHNGGDGDCAIALAQKAVATFENYPFVVVPSASCAGMIKYHYPHILSDDAIWHARAEVLAAKTHELFDFLVNIRGMKTMEAVCNRIAACHVSCSSLRETGSAGATRELLASISGLRLKDIPDTEICCGFGGLFSVKFPEISARMADDKIANVKATGADLLVGPDLGCLLHLAGRISRLGEPIEVRHAAELFSGMADPSIGADR
jgi:L-lactate dehydrogenase complex protein LldE